MLKGEGQNASSWPQNSTLQTYKWLYILLLLSAISKKLNYLQFS